MWFYSRAFPVFSTAQRLPHLPRIQHTGVCHQLLSVCIRFAPVSLLAPVVMAACGGSSGAPESGHVYLDVVEYIVVTLGFPLCEWLLILTRGKVRKTLFQTCHRR